MSDVDQLLLHVFYYGYRTGLIYCLDYP